MKNYKLIYILGSGHSGSTLLDMIIGSSPTAFSIGELAFYSHYSERIPHKKIDKNKGYICTCGREVVDCPFWKRILKKINLDKPIIKNRGHIDTYKIFLNILNPFEKQLSFKTKVSHNKIVLETILSEAKKIKPHIKFLVDSSKDPRRLYELVHDKDINRKNIVVLYLARDAFSYVNSYNKDVRTISGVKKRNIFVTLIEWLAVHVSSRVLIRKYRLKHLDIKYKDFASDPDIAINKIFNFLGIGRNESSKNLLKKVNKNTYHNLHGNFVKFKKFTTIAYDESWKTNLSITEKIITKVFLYPFHFWWNL